MQQLGWITPAEEAAAREEKSNLAGLNRFKAALALMSQMQLLRS